MIKKIMICDFCGKEKTEFATHHTKTNPKIGGARSIDICSDCEELFIKLCNATPEVRAKAVEILKGETDEEG